ncbi:MAG: peroxide stress protein YaaA, partial [Syntrophothermus sp.]
MLILLPPSEGKSAPARGTPVDLSSLAHAAELGEARGRLLDALEVLARERLEVAVAALGLSAGQAGEVDVDARLRSAPAAPARDVYSGVLYDRLGLAAMPAAAQERVLIVSALWGVLRPSDRIPYYRLAAQARLPEVGRLASHWRAPLTAALPDEEDELI